MLGSSGLLGQDSRDADGVTTDKSPVAPLGTKGGAIDVHHHMRPPIPGAVGNANWTPAMSIEAMDKFNIAAALLSLTMQRAQIYDGTEKGRALVRTVNDFGAKCVVLEHPAHQSHRERVVGAELFRQQVEFARLRGEARPSRARTRRR